MSTEIESLELKITSNSASARKGIDALTQSLNKLRSATKGGAGLSVVSVNMNVVANVTKKATRENEKARLSSPTCSM